MATVIVTAAAQRQVVKLPSAIQIRISEIIDRLVNWPTVSGAKSLRHELKGAHRIRTGSYRVLFTVAGDTVTIFRVDDRRDVYE